jgi:hypothetical protein
MFALQQSTSTQHCSYDSYRLESETLSMSIATTGFRGASFGFYVTIRQLHLNVTSHALPTTAFASIDAYAVPDVFFAAILGSVLGINERLELVNSRQLIGGSLDCASLALKLHWPPGS